MAEHDRIDEGDLTDKIKALLDYANHLDLHGVFLVSPPCPDCGMLHHFTVVTDIPATAGQNVSTLLRTFAEHCEETPSTTFEKSQRTPPQ